MLRPAVAAWRWLPALSAAAAAVVWPPAAGAAGGDSIADAPTVAYGQLEVGGGLAYTEFWKLPVTAGDRVTLDVNTDIGREDDDATDFRLLDPSVDDYTLAAHTRDGLGGGAGRSQLSWRAPSSGEWTLWVASWRNFTSANGGPPPYTFIADRAHATSVSVTGPNLARRGTLVTIQGRVRSPAGTPAGTCLIGGDPIALSSTGTCTGRVRLAGGTHSTIGVSFVADDGWQSSSGHHTIRLYK